MTTPSYCLHCHTPLTTIFADYCPRCDTWLRLEERVRVIEDERRVLAFSEVCSMAAHGKELRGERRWTIT
jgi:hypothetical protein